jgi:Tol biopolymer transport system component
MQEQIWLMAADGSQPHKLVGDEGDVFGAVAWSPDSTKLAYTRGRFSYGFGVKGVIEFFDVRNQHVSSLFSINTVRWFASLNGPLTWADGHLICTLNEQPPRQLDSNLWSIAIDPGGHAIGDPVRLTSDPGAVSRISSSADGNRVVYVKGVPQPDVYIAKLQGHEIIGEPERLTLDDRQDFPFDWTTDDKSVIFISDRTGVFSIYRQAINQTVPELLVGGKGTVTIPRLSPDGTQILYLVDPSWSAPESGSSSSIPLMRVPLAGGAPQQVLQADGISNQQCSRAPATLCLYSVVGPGALTLFSYDPLKGKGAQVYQIKDELPQLYNWSLSPDGNTLAIAKGKQGDKDPQIHLVSLNTAAERVITVRGLPGLASIDWAYDSKSLWAPSVGDEENPLLNIDLQGHARPVWHPRKLNVRWAIPSRDGKYLALHVSSSSADVWMLERP